MMLNRTHLERYAQVLFWGLKTSRQNRFRRNDTLLIRFDLQALSLAEVLFCQLMERGFNPIPRIGLTPKMERSFFDHGSMRQLTFRVSGEEQLYQSLNGSIYLHAPDSITHLAGVDPKKIAKVAVSRKYLRDLLTRREEEGHLGWTLCTYPTEELASQANLTQKEYTQQIIRACFLNRKDPVAQWREVYRNAQSIKKWLNAMDVRHFHIESENIDLIVKPGACRRWIGISGHNIPSFELFLSPDWRGTQGRFFADQPSFRSGNLVRAATLEFKKGTVVHARAEQGQSFLQDQLTMDRGAGRLGEFSLTDKRFSKINRFMANTLFDENYGGRYGNCHVAVGSSYSDTYDGPPSDLTKAAKRKLGFNDSALHWDLVNTEKKRVQAHLTDGTQTTIYENGLFMY